MKFPLTFCAVIACINVYAGSNTAKDSNIVISSAKEVYEFVYDKSSNSVQVKESLNTNYLCNDFRSSIPVVEFYNDEAMIDAVDFSVDGKKPKGITPIYSYYQIDDYFYSDAHVCYFPLLLDKKGSVAEVDFQKTIKDPRYLTNVFFSDIYPVTSKQIIFKVPKWMNIELKEMNFNGYNITKTKDYDSKNDEDVYTYTAMQVGRTGERKILPRPNLYLSAHSCYFKRSQPCK